jgi:hypothetical protein
VSDAATINKDFARRLAGTVRRLTSNMPEEVDTAAQAVARILRGASKDVIFGIAERIENESNGQLNDAEMKEIFDAGVAHGQKLSAQSQAQAQQAYPQMPSAFDMAVFCNKQMERLNDWERGFITNMVRWSRHGSLSPKRQSKLEDIYIKLGGSV